MQLTFSCLPTTYRGLEHTLSKARLARYCDATVNDPHHGLRLYVWNARLCEALYFPVQACEVAVRNSLHGALIRQYGPSWYMRQSFTRFLPQRLGNELSRTIRDEKSLHGAQFTAEQLVSGLSLGFWLNILTRRYNGTLWPAHFGHCFPYKPANVDRQMLYDSVDRVRILRNRIAHHKPVFDRCPTAEYQHALTILSWICPETRWFIKTVARVSQTMNERPSD